MTEELDIVKPKFTLGEFRIQPMFGQSTKYYSQMFSMFFPASRVYEDIFNKHNHELVHIGLEHAIHQVHESSWCIRQSKWHH